ncbi:MAG: hypothetical protein IJI59_01800 [Clostridia bacterium]|jgi:hypothetical protein|nr:hypothetical protein [Clostridia bacterium]MBQ6325808.1 hypothetical protein [Clostridia bacterium]MBQ8964429.1 hypothetical protein [Clostridia bacterium]
MTIQALEEAAKGLFGICVTVAALEQLAGEGGPARTFRALCALAATLCALRMFARLF